MAKRTKKSIETTIRSMADLETRMGEFAAISAQRELLEAELNERITALRAEYEDRISEVDDSFNRVFDDISVYATLHPEIFPQDRKSLDLLHGTLGFRTGMPRCTLPRGVEESELCEGMLALPATAKFVRRTCVVDKERVIALFSRRLEVGPKSSDADALRVLDGLGVRVSQTERFYIEPKAEDLAK